MRRADVNDDEERGLQVGRQGRDNSSNGLDASPRRSNDHNVSRGSGQASRRAFSIARLDADHPVPPLPSRYSRMSAVIRSPSAIPAVARLRRDQVPGHLGHHLAKFIKLVTRAAQNRRHHLVRQRVVEGCPRAVAFGAPMFMGDGEPRSVKSDVGFGTILDHLTPSWQIAEVRPSETAQVGRPETCGRSPLASLPLKSCPESKPWSPFTGQLDGVDYVFYQQGSQNRKIDCKFYFHRCF